MSHMRRCGRPLGLLFQIILVTALTAVTARGQEWKTVGSTLCSGPGIVGMVAPAKRAVRVIGDRTSVSPSLGRFYITMERDTLYVHSNLLSASSGYERKATIEFARRGSEGEVWQGIDFFTVFERLAVPEGAPFSPEIVRRVRRAYEEEATFYIEQAVLHHPAGRLIDFSGAQNVYVLGQEVSQVGPGLFIRGARTRASLAALDQLASRKLPSFDVVSFVTDANTNTTLKEGLGGRATIYDPATADLPTIFAARKNSVLVALGHVNKSRFEAVNADGKVVFTVELAQLKTLARTNNVALVLLGCNTGKVGEPGTLGRFSTGDAARQLVLARAARSWGVFLNKMVSKDIQIVVDPRELILRRGAVFSIRAGAPEAVVGTITFLGAITALGDDENRKHTLPGMPPRSLGGLLMALAPTEGLQIELEKRKEFVEAARRSYPAAVEAGLLIPPDACNALCWSGALVGEAAGVERFCELAVQAAPSHPGFRDSRGVVRALLGKLDLAVPDFEYFIKQTTDDNARSVRSEWLIQLRKGKNPITSDGLKALLLKESQGI